MSATTKLIEAARDVVANTMHTYKANNNRQVGLEDENGEKCLIVPFHSIDNLNAALDDYDKRREELKKHAIGG